LQDQPLGAYPSCESILRTTFATLPGPTWQALFLVHASLDLWILVSRFLHPFYGLLFWVISVGHFQW
jgi:hypothetical protein